MDNVMQEMVLPTRKETLVDQIHDKILEIIIQEDVSERSVFTEGKLVQAHTADRLYLTDRKLYELEESLPGSFMRISKSTIVNLDHIYSITRNLTASSIVEFYGTAKKVYVSRNYYKALTERLGEKRRKI